MRGILERKQINRAHQCKAAPKNGTNYVPINATNATKGIGKHSFEINFPAVELIFAQKSFEIRKTKKISPEQRLRQTERGEEMVLSFAK